MRDIIGADRLIFQGIDDLIDAVKDTKYSNVEGFDCAVFNGMHVTGQINEAYLDNLQQQRSDTAKANKGVQIVADTPVDIMTGVLKSLKSILVDLGTRTTFSLIPPDPSSG